MAGWRAGEDEDLGAGHRALDLAGGFEAVHVRHGVIHDDEVRPQLGGRAIASRPSVAVAQISQPGFSAWIRVARPAWMVG